jgi:histidinol phosphatase-like PHP family hydrolase
MKRWEPLMEHIGTGEWHVHTNYTDGHNTVMEMCEQAQKNRLTLIAITEHVRKETLYEWSSLKKEVEEARKAFPNIRILLGCEAKVLGTDGELDIQESLKNECDLLVGVFHGFPTNDKTSLLQAARNMLKDPLLDVFGHPMTLLKRSEPPLTEPEILSLMEDCRKNNILVEISGRYPSSPELTAAIEKSGVRTVPGSDAHRITEIRKI